MGKKKRDKNKPYSIDKIKKCYRKAKSYDEAWRTFGDFSYASLQRICSVPKNMTGKEIGNIIKIIDIDAHDMVKGYDIEVEKGFGISGDWFRYVIVQHCKSISEHICKMLGWDIKEYSDPSITDSTTVKHISFSLYDSNVKKDTKHAFKIKLNSVGRVKYGSQWKSKHSKTNMCWKVIDIENNCATLESEETVNGKYMYIKRYIDYMCKNWERVAS